MVSPAGTLCQGPLWSSGGPTCTRLCALPTSRAGKVAGSHTYWKAISNLPSCLKQVKAGPPFSLARSLSFMGPTCQITILGLLLLWLLLQLGEFLLSSLKPQHSLSYTHTRGTHTHTRTGTHTHAHTRQRRKETDRNTSIYTCCNLQRHIDRFIHGFNSIPKHTHTITQEESSSELCTSPDSP